MTMQQSRSSSPLMHYLGWPNRVLYRLYQWTIAWSRTKYAKLALFFVALTESSFFPIPPDVLLIAMTVGDRFRWWLYATITTLGSVLGAVIGYVIGYALYESVGKPIVDFYGLGQYFDVVRDRYEANVFLAVVTAALTPIPFKVFTIAGGMFSVNLPALILGAIVGRAGRFYLVALALRIFGKAIADSIEKYFNILSLVFMALLIGGFVAIRFLF